jgi:hypothetical protein
LVVWIELRLRILVCGSRPCWWIESGTCWQVLRSIALHGSLKSRCGISLRLQVYRMLSYIRRLSVLLPQWVICSRISPSSKVCRPSSVSTDRVSPCSSSLTVVYFCILYSCLLWRWRWRIIDPVLRCHFFVSVLKIMMCSAVAKFKLPKKFISTRVNSTSKPPLIFNLVSTADHELS